MPQLDGRVAIVTGAAQGQGRAEAELFAERGAHVVVVDLKQAEGEKVAAELTSRGLSADFQLVDVTDESDWERLERTVRSDRGRLDVLVNNAGAAHRVGLMDTKTDDWNRILTTNLTGPFLGTRTLAPLIRDSGGGAIVNVGSAAGMTGHFAAAYSASKWGLRGLSKVAAMEFAPWHIRVNSIHPGIVNTALVPGDTRFPAAMATYTPAGRVAEPDEIAPLVAFLASDEARYITGVDVPVDGGLVELGVYDAVAKEFGLRD